MARLQRDYESPACEQVALGFRSSFLFSPFLRILSNLKDIWPQNALGLEPGSLIGQASAECLWISSSIGVVSEHAKATGWLGNQTRLFSPACPTSGPQNTNDDRWFRAAPNMNLTQGALWAFKSQFGNPTMSPYWTFEKDRPSTAARASCWAATYKNWSPMVCASCC